MVGCCYVGVEEGEDIAGDGGCEGLVSAVSVPVALCGVDRDGEVFLSDGAWRLVWECACAQVVWGAVEVDGVCFCGVDADVVDAGKAH